MKTKIMDLNANRHLSGDYIGNDCCKNDFNRNWPLTHIDIVIVSIPVGI